MHKRWFVIMLAAVMVLTVSLTSCGGGGGEGDGGKSAVTGLAGIDNSAWRYSKSDKVYYQMEIPYCEKPSAENCQLLAVFVPAKYMDAKSNGDGTYTCTINKEGKVKGYTAETAPVVMPVDTPDYAAQMPLTEYTDVTAYTKAGYVYVHAGCRGIESGAPAGVTDLKAAVRYLRCCDAGLPGNAECIFIFGTGAGGTQAAVVGASGDCPKYDPYLTDIGAVQGVSDAVYGAACWSAVPDLEIADAAYEWMMGSTRTGLDEEQQEISDKLAIEFSEYVNIVTLRDPDGARLTLEESEEGIWQSGSYYEYIRGVIENSLRKFFKDNSFPYELPAPGEDGEPVVFETPQDYIDYLNKDIKWVTYDEKKGKVTITSVADFVQVMRPATRGIGAFDSLDRGGTENMLFGYGDGGTHFDGAFAEILNGMGSKYTGDFVKDLAKTDRAGNAVDVRVEIYTPLWYLLEGRGGFGTSRPAAHWRLRSGICNTDCALVGEAELALVLGSNEAVQDVDFKTIWGKSDIDAESKGKSTKNFIKWIRRCTKDVR